MKKMIVLLLLLVTGSSIADTKKAFVHAAYEDRSTYLTAVKTGTVKILDIKNCECVEEQKTAKCNIVQELVPGDQIVYSSTEVSLSCMKSDYGILENSFYSLSVAREVMYFSARTGRLTIGHVAPHLER